MCLSHSWDLVPELGSEGQVGLGGCLGAEEETGTRRRSEVCRATAAAHQVRGGPREQARSERRAGERLGPSLVPTSLCLPTPRIHLPEPLFDQAPPPTPYLPPSPLSPLSRHPCLLHRKLPPPLTLLGLFSSFSHWSSSFIHSLCSSSISPLECQLHQGRHSCLFHSLLYPQVPGQE